MIKPKKSARELWNQLGLRNHIKQAFQEKETTWGQIVDSNKKNLDQSQRSVSEYAITQKLKDQHNSFLQNKEKPPTKTFLEDQFGIGNQEKQEWQQLAIDNEKSQISPNTKRTSNDQTFSPINRLKADESQQYNSQTLNQIQNVSKLSQLQQQPQLLSTCKLAGHENNQYKFICLDNDCPYKLQKACAHCVIKMHTKHVSSMKEIETYEQLIEENLKRAENLIISSQKIMQSIVKPFEECFQQIKDHVLFVIDELQQRLLQQNKDKIQRLVQSEVERLSNLNSKFEAYKLMNTLIPDETIKEYQNLLTTVSDKIKIDLNLDSISKSIESHIMSIMSDKKIKELKDQSDSTDILQHLLTTNRDSNRESIIQHSHSVAHQSPMQTKKTVQTKMVMGSASPMNVFNRQINGRQLTKIIQTQPIIYYRTNT